MKRFVVTPNASLTARQAFGVFVGISVIALAIAVSFALVGLWMVLPFAGAELLLLGYGLFCALRQGSFREIITITEDRVRVVAGYSRLALSYECQRGWAKVDLRKSPVTGYPSRLAIRSHGKEIEIGSFLVESERAFLAEELRKSLAWHEEIFAN